MVQFPTSLSVRTISPQVKEANSVGLAESVDVRVRITDETRLGAGRGCHERRLGAGRRVAVLAGYDLTEVAMSYRQSRRCT